MKIRLPFTVYRLPFKCILLSTLYSLLSTFLLCGCQSGQLFRDSQIMMGTTVEVVSPDRRAGKVVFQEIKRTEDILSKYKEDSEVSKLNKNGYLENASADTMYVLRKSREFWQVSRGAFDITIGPLMDLWGFTPLEIQRTKTNLRSPKGDLSLTGFTHKEYCLPKERDIREALKRVGVEKIVFNDTGNVVKFTVSGMKIDLGAIAKGYAVDCAVKKLKMASIKSCLINAGGDIYCLGDRPRTFSLFEFLFSRDKKVRGRFGAPWTIALQDPRGEGFLDYLELRDKAVATSGDYAQYFIKGRKRYAHIFNPKTGYPADSGVVSVTVVAPDCLTADALATSIFVLGKARSEEIVKKFPDVKVRIIEE